MKILTNGYEQESSEIKFLMMKTPQVPIKVAKNISVPANEILKLALALCLIPKHNMY